MGIHNSIAIVYKQMILQAGFLTGQSQHDKYPKLQCVGHCSRYLPVALDVFRVGGTTVVGQQTICSTCSVCMDRSTQLYQQQTGLDVCLSVHVLTKRLLRKQGTK